MAFHWKKPDFVKKQQPVNTKGIISLQQKFEADKLLDVWASDLLRIEENISKVGMVIKEDNFDFMHLIGRSIYVLNECNSLLIAQIESAIKELPTGHNDIPGLSSIVDYMRFYNNLIASKVKYFFFRETHVKNANNPFVDITKKMVISGYDLTTELMDSSIDKINYEKIKGAVCKYLYLQNLIYSFIFKDNERCGVFLHFEYAKVEFNEISNKITDYANLILSSNIDSKLRLFCSGVIGIIIRYYKEQNSASYEHSKPIAISSYIIDKPACYSDLYDLVKVNSISIEPLTYRLCDTLWKINGMIKAENNYLHFDNRNSYSIENVRIVSNFIESYLSLCAEMYEENKINYRNLFECEASLMKADGIYTNVFKPNDANEVKNNFIQISNIQGEKEDIITAEHLRFTEIQDITDLSIRNENYFKLETFIEKLQLNDILGLLQCFAAMIEPSINDIYKEGVEFVGFYKSGAFLGHILNLLYNKRKTIWLFNTRPYVATHPIHKDTNHNKAFDKIILFDESIKTGFTYTLYESYLLRNMYYHDVSTVLYSLFNFEHYSKIRHIESNKYLALLRYAPDNTMMNSLVNSSSAIQDWVKRNCSGGLFYYKKDLNMVIDGILGKASANDGRVDLSYLLSDTDIICTIADEFCQILKKSNHANKNVLIFTPSINGSVILLMTMFLLKAKYKINATVCSDENIKNIERDGYFLVGIDLSIVSGLTMVYDWSLIKYKFYDINSDIANKIKDFNLILTVYNGGCNSYENVKSLYYCN